MTAGRHDALAPEAGAGPRRHVEDLVLAVLLGVMVVLTAASVGSRALLPQLQIAYLDQLLPNLLVWVSMLGVAAAARHGGHLGMSAVVNLLPVPARRAAVAFSAGCGVVFLAVMAWQGWYIIEQQFALGSMSAFGYPAWLVSAAVPVGALLAILRIVQAAAEEWRAAARAGGHTAAGSP